MLTKYAQIELVWPPICIARSASGALLQSAAQKRAFTFAVYVVSVFSVWVIVLVAHWLVGSVAEYNWTTKLQPTLALVKCIEDPFR